MLQTLVLSSQSQKSRDACTRVELEHHLPQLGLISRGCSPAQAVVLSLLLLSQLYPQQPCSPCLTKASDATSHPPPLPSVKLQLEDVFWCEGTGPQPRNFTKHPKQGQGRCLCAQRAFSNSFLRFSHIIVQAALLFPLLSLRREQARSLPLFLFYLLPSFAEHPVQNYKQGGTSGSEEKRAICKALD